MKGIVLAGGTGTRLFPLTKVTNKHLLPIGRYPMIFHPIFRLKQAGIKDILVVTGLEHMGDMVSLLGSGREFGVKFTYKVQDEAGGIAQALGLAEEFVGNDCCCVILGDNIFEDSIAPYVQNFMKQCKGAKIMIKEVPDPERFGVPVIKDDKIIGIQEKPQHPESNFCVIGIYMYDSEVFDIIKTLKPSRRGELEITDVNNSYITKGELTYDIIKGSWTDAGTFESLLKANQLAEHIILDFNSFT